MTDTFIGRSLGKYTVESKLGQGGMGMVYRGRQTSLNRSVAIKVLPAQMAMDTDFVQRFRQEAQVIAGLQHENIVHVYDIDRTALASGESLYFIVMEYVDGYNLRQRPDRGVPMPWQRVREIGLPVARALDYAHRRGIVHRDIKPANVMVTTDGKVKLMDFGIAKSAGGVRTATGSVLGTPEYMAPEQAQSGQVTPRSDIYALGVVLYELATGKLPFEAPEPFAVALKHISEAPRPPRQVEPSVPQWLEQLILRALAKNPADRQGDAATVARELELAGGEAVSSHLSALAGTAPLSMDLAPTLETPSASRVHDRVQASVPTVDPGAPTLQTPASGVQGAGAAPTHLPTQLATPTDSSWQGASGPFTASRRPVAWWPVAALLGALALVAAGWWMTRGGVQPVGGDAATPDAAAESPASDLDAARELLAAGDLHAARRHLDAYLAGHPDDAQAAEVSRRLDHAERSLAQAMAEKDLQGEIDGAPSELAESPPDDSTAAEPAPAEPQAKTARPDSQPPAVKPSEPASEPTSEPRPADARPLPQLQPERAAPSGPPLRQLMVQARRHREAKEFHSLRRILGEISARDDRPGRRDDELEEWISKVDGWVVDREKDLREAVDDLLDSFVEAVEDEDMDDIEDLWGDRVDSTTESAFRNLWQTYRKVRAEYELVSVEPWDHEASFTAVVRIYGKQERSDDMALVRTVRWQGRISDRDGKRFVAPFAPGSR